MRRLGKIAIAVGLVAFSVQAAPMGRAEGPRRFVTQLDNIEVAVERLVKAYANPLAIFRKYPNQKRLLDARVFYELGQFENAAIVLYDVVERPDFQGDLEYEAALLLLGESLLKIDNPRAARDILSKVVAGRDAQLAEEARLDLLEIALSNDTDDALRRALSEIGGSANSDRTRYGLGKAYLRLGEPEKAIAWLQNIAAHSDLYARARYYLGASYVALTQYDLALEVFRGLTTLRGDEPLTAELRDQAWLAVGRVLVQQGHFDTALTSYQNIGRYSPHYEVALYEMAWAYVNQEKFDKALQTVEVLLLTVSDEAVDIEAHVLRGQLNVVLGDYEEALASYQTIVDRYAPIRNELSKFVKNPGDVQRYFTWLLERRNGASAALQSPLSEKTAKWIESTADFRKVAAVFDRISLERADIDSAKATAEQLDKMLTANNRVELFPELRAGWTQALVIENRMALLLSQMLDAEGERVAGQLTPDELNEQKELVTWRRHLEDQAAHLPTTFEAYDARQENVARRYRELERKNYFVEQSYQELQKQLLAIEKYLDEKQYADAGEKLTPEKEASMREEIVAQKEEMQKLFGELSNLKKEIAVEAKSIGTGDEATRGENTLKQSLIEALEKEGVFYDRVGARLGGPIAKDLGAYSDARGRFSDIIIKLDGVIAAIDKEVGIKTKELIADVRHEAENLQGYGVEVGGLDRDGRVVATRLGDEFFKRAQGRMDQVVLDADVGLLDVTWARKNERTTALQKLNDERSRRLRQLQDDLESIKSGAADESAEKKTDEKKPGDKKPGSETTPAPEDKKPEGETPATPAPDAKKTDGATPATPDGGGP